MTGITPITIPQWGLEMTEGALSHWHINIGDVISKGTEIADIETSKIVNTLEGDRDLEGVVRRLVAKEGDTLPVGALIAVVAKESVSDEDVDRFLAEQGAEVGQVNETDSSTGEGADDPREADQTESGLQSTASDLTPTTPRIEPAPLELSPEELARIKDLNSNVHASPVARRVANRVGVDLNRLTGSGRNGRISLQDLENQAEAPNRIGDETSVKKLSAEELEEINAGVKSSPVARRIANRMGVDLRAISGSGRHGRVSVSDIEPYHAGNTCLSISSTSSPDSWEGGAAGLNADLRAGPAVRKLADELGLDLSQMEPSGPRQNFIKEDVKNAFRERFLAQARGDEPEFDLFPMTAMRRAIANSLVQSKQTVPHFYLTIDVDCGPLADLRAKMNEKLPKGRKKLSLNDFLLRGTALALSEVPEANVHYSEEGIKQFRSVHLCVAVAIDGGLVTPVIRCADSKGLYEIADEAQALAVQGKDRKLRSEQLSGGTFTVSNLGMFGIKQFDAVINPPQGGILAVGTSRREAFEREDGSVGFKPVMSLTMSCDHRVIDGAVGASFLAVLKEYLENPYQLLS